MFIGFNNGWWWTIWLMTAYASAQSPSLDMLIVVSPKGLPTVVRFSQAAEPWCNDSSAGSWLVIACALFRWAQWQVELSSEPTAEHHHRFYPNGTIVLNGVLEGYAGWFEVVDFSHAIVSCVVSPCRIIYPTSQKSSHRENPSQFIFLGVDDIIYRYSRNLQSTQNRIGYNPQGFFFWQILLLIITWYTC